MADNLPPTTPFDALRHVEGDTEYWSARDLAKLLGYRNWQNFQVAVKRASTACEQSGHDPADHFIETNKMVTVGSGAHRRIADWHLSRYACYLVVQNADPAKPIVALGQTYFAVQTRRQEEADALAQLSEAQRRLRLRGQVAHHNRELADTARSAGVITGADFAVFQDHGYMGLYNGERARDIHRRKGLRPGAPILDHMGSEELAANDFRATQAEAKIRREGIQSRAAANQAHQEVGAVVRQTIADLGGTLPEDLPTPADSIAQLTRRQAQLDAGQQPLFGEDEIAPIKES